MVADKRWKYVHAIGFRPMLYDLETDPQEFRDLGADPAFEPVRQRLAAALAQWGLRLSQRTTLSEDQVRNMRGTGAAPWCPDRRLGRERRASGALAQLSG